MPLAFLAPLFLAGLAAIAIPVIVHLTHRQRKEVEPFPSLAFLARVPFRTVRRQRIRDPLLFALRCLALAFLAFAFARPFLRRAVATADAGHRRRDIVILLDRSYSMGTGDRWQRAIDSVRKVEAGLAGGDRIALVLFDAAAEVVAPLDESHAAFDAGLSRAAPTFGVTRYAPALQAARQLLAASEGARADVILVSDFQRRGWDRDDDLHLSTGATLATVDLSQPLSLNASLAGVGLARSTTRGRDEVTVSARLANTGTGRVAGMTAELEIAGKVIGRKTVTADSGAAATVVFDPIPSPPGATAATVRIPGDALAADNAWNFVIAPRQTLPVVLVQEPDADGRAGMFLRQALAVGGDPQPEIRVRRPDQLARSDLASARLLILNDAPLARLNPAPLREYLRNGGAVLLILGPRSGNSRPDLADLLPGTWGDPVDRVEDRGAAIAWLDYTHPSLAAFQAPHSGDFAAPRFFRYRRVRPDSSASVLARLDDGSPLIVEQSAGGGTVVLWASASDNVWNDLPVQPVFLPLVHETVRYLARVRPPTPWILVRQTADLRDMLGPPEGSELDIVGGGRSGDLTDGRFLTPVAPGLLTVRVRAGAWNAPVAVNVDVTESDPAAFDPAELVAAATPDSTIAEAAVAVTPAQQERRQGGWWYLLLAGLALLAAEGLLASRVRHRVA